MPSEKSSAPVPVPDPKRPRVFYPHFPSPMNQLEKSASASDLAAWAKALSKGLWELASSGDPRGQLAALAAIVKDFDYDPNPGKAGLYVDAIRNIVNAAQAQLPNMPGLPAINLYDVFLVWTAALENYRSVLGVFEISLKEYDNDSNPDSALKVLHQMPVPDSAG
ncbi:MAG: hypothetical protein ABR584_02885 [Candidatus Baltobacteraceae bacterium]